MESDKVIDYHREGKSTFSKKSFCSFSLQSHLPYPLSLRHQEEVTQMGGEVSSVSKALWRVVKNFCYK